ncbi:hypothetical protein [Cystobacter ferrugineus]|uniref:hypothetical protein n=1 Tax=Cystobacter ferrugineus TaxID=83449 RepID=UPI0011614553|nr:hypothetical protein [Cystobacter ferrugineus]
MENPTLPWTKSVTLFPGADVGIGMEGSVTNGRFEVKYNGTLSSTSGGSSDAQVSGARVCSRQVSLSTSEN